MTGWGKPAQARCHAPTHMRGGAEENCGAYCAENPPWRKGHFGGTARSGFVPESPLLFSQPGRRASDSHSARLLRLTLAAMASILLVPPEFIPPHIAHLANTPRDCNPVALGRRSKSLAFSPPHSDRGFLTREPRGVADPLRASRRNDVGDGASSPSMPTRIKRPARCNRGRRRGPPGRLRGGGRGVGRFCVPQRYPNRCTRYETRVLRPSGDGTFRLETLPLCDLDP